MDPTRAHRLDEFPTVAAAARRLPCSPKILRAARDRGELPVYRLGGRWERVHWPELVAWLRSHRVPATPHAVARVAEVLLRERRRALENGARMGGAPNG